MLLTIAGSSCSGKTTAAHAGAAIEGLVVSFANGQLSLGPGQWATA